MRSTSTIERHLAASAHPQQILFLTFDGVLEPLGRSQVIGYITGLADCGFSYILISLEREQDLENRALIAKTEQLLANHGIAWICLPYRQGGAKHVVENIRVMTTEALKAIREQSIALVHARAYVTALIAFCLKVRTGTRYVFDARGYWIDEKAAEGAWFTSATSYAVAKFIERFMFRRASGIVTLTHLMADDIRSGILRGDDEIPIAVIPTCTDFSKFQRNPDLKRSAPKMLEARLHGKLVLGMIGAINSSYHSEEALYLFRRLLQLRPDAHLLWITRQSEMAAELARRANIPKSDITAIDSSHEDMPMWLNFMDWGFLLLKEDFAKRGSVPTKLGEMLACEVRPIHYGCNVEIAAIVRDAGSGISLRDLSEESLQRAAFEIASSHNGGETLYRARSYSEAIFSLESGIQKYEALIREAIRHNP